MMKNNDPREPALERLSVNESILVQAYRRCTPEKQDAGLYLLRDMARSSPQEPAVVVLHLVGRRP